MIAGLVLLATVVVNLDVRHAPKTEVLDEACVALSTEQARWNFAIRNRRAHGDEGRTFRFTGGNGLASGFCDLVSSVGLTVNGISWSKLQPDFGTVRRFSGEKTEGVEFTLCFDGAKVNMRASMRENSPTLDWEVRPLTTGSRPVTNVDVRVTAIPSHIRTGQGRFFGYRRQMLTDRRRLPPQKAGKIPLRDDERLFVFEDAEFDGSAEDRGHGPSAVLLAEPTKGSVTLNDSWLTDVHFTPDPAKPFRFSLFEQPGMRMSNAEFESQAFLLERAVRTDVVEPVRPGGVDGRPFWNAHALWFMYPPAFDFKTVSGAATYRFEVRDSRRKTWTMTADRPTAVLVDVWVDLPPGLTDVTCRGVDAKGAVCGVAGTRRFWKQAPFKPGAYPKAKCSYRAAARKLIGFLVDTWKPAQVLDRTGRPDPVYQYNCYPAKTGSALVNVMLMAARECPEKAEKALRLARKEADYLMSVTPTKGPLAYFTPTYLFHPEAVATNRFAPETAQRLEGQCMVRYSAEVGLALLRLSEATGERRYADFAVKCGETFLRLQRPDGTWPCMMRFADGAAMRRDDIILIERIGYFEKLQEVTGDRRYAKLAADVLAQIERNQMRTWDWQGQFEDTALAPEPYKDLTGTDALPAACYLLKKFPGDAKRMAEAREMIRYGEDQFTCWERPYHADGTCPSSGLTVEGKWYDSTYATWFCPGVSEQYACMVPIDASACRMIWGYLALHRATGDVLALAKARVLGDSLVNKQQANGGIETYWYDTGMRLTDGCDEIDWLDCMMDDLEALLDLAALDPS